MSEKTRQQKGAKPDFIEITDMLRGFIQKFYREFKVQK